MVTGAPFPVVLRAGTRNESGALLLQSYGVKSALFITAHNPGGRLLSPQENQLRHTELLAALQPWPLLEGFRVSDSGDRPAETGVLVLCDVPKLQSEWQRRFEEEAAVRVSDQGDVELLFKRNRASARSSAPPEMLTQEQLQGLSAFSEFPPHQRLCFYPSSGYQLLWSVMQLDCDLFVFSDKDRRYSSWSQIQADFAHHRRPLELIARGSDFVRFRSGCKTGVLLWEDNNLVLDRLQLARLQVHHFVGICDGCSEGGNYECVHERPFVQRLMRVAADGMCYSTDHSRPLQGFGSHDGRGIFHNRKFLERVALRDFPEPPGRHVEPRWPEPHPTELPEATFMLQGVLICTDAQGRHPRFEVLPKGSELPTQLGALKPFRAFSRRGILAEYRVSIIERNQAELNLNLF